MMSLFHTAQPGPNRHTGPHRSGPAGGACTHASGAQSRRRAHMLRRFALCVGVALLVYVVLGAVMGLHATRQVVVARHTIERGSVIGATDVQYQQFPATDSAGSTTPWADAADDLQLVSNHIAQFTITAGSVVFLDMVAQQPVLQAGQTIVDVQLASRSQALTGASAAQSNAAAAATPENTDYTSDTVANAGTGTDTGTSTGAGTPPLMLPGTVVSLVCAQPCNGADVNAAGSQGGTASGGDQASNNTFSVCTLSPKAVVMGPMGEHGVPMAMEAKEALHVITMQEHTPIVAMEPQQPG
ncbi:SAF domain-containing protein [Bifidobacterium gallicum]|nr:SAF domain-containing protein [Bifidobacterium gallicum]